MNKKPQRFTWAATESGWRNSQKKLVPFSEMNKKQLQTCYTLAHQKELEYTNKSYVMADKIQEMDVEAKRRGVELKEYKSDYHLNKKLIKGS